MMEQETTHGIATQQQTYILKVYIHCEGCKRDVTKLLLSIEGVSMVKIDAAQNKVIVTGTIESADVLLKKLIKAGKPAELWKEEDADADKSTAELKSEAEHPSHPEWREQSLQCMNEEEGKGKGKRKSKSDDGDDDNANKRSIWNGYGRLRAVRTRVNVWRYHVEQHIRVSRVREEVPRILRIEFSQADFKRSVTFLVILLAVLASIWLSR